ncbi:penicillin-binding transpeptidase domain-containing protein [Streptomyces sp. NPDC060194]|uniref:penicillin-binding transpeptidase domain-containing protein n=1 Tax=Streptomyces sp. NPDC060194 TaxID=3347069 RepID=UPI003659AB0D
MIRYIRRAAAFLLLLLVALLVNASRIQVLQTDSLADNPANKRQTILRWSQPRGDILVGDRPVTGAEDTGERYQWERTYTEGPLYAPVTGYASQTYGTTLLEAVEDDVLAGTDPDLSAFPVGNELTRAQNPGGDVATTIDAAAQRAAFRGLGSARGAVAAIEPATGKVLALASTPSYDPGSFAGTDREAQASWDALMDDPDQPMLNRALRQVYPPGSTFKVVTAAAALTEGVVTDADAPTDSPDPYVLPDTTSVLRNENPDSRCEDASLRYALQVSCNTVFARLGVRVGLGDMVKAAEGFGFDDAGLTVPVGVARSNFDTDMNRPQLAQSSIGQFNTTATPLQMAMVAAAVANDGRVMRPRLVEETRRSDGSVLGRPADETYRTAMSPGVAQTLKSMTESVVTDGTGSAAAIEGVTVGGKTGTAQNGEDNEGTPFAWFIAWAQSEGAGAPEVAVAVVIEDSGAARAEVSGGGLAAPIAREVMSAVLAR